MRTFISLFSGCGGFDVGFVQAEFRPLGAFDIDPKAVSVYRRNIEGPAAIADLADARSPLIRGPAVDVVIAGPPCQGFSTVGKRNPNDPRNGLLLSAGRIAAMLRPKVVVIENVKGVLAGLQRTYWEELVCALRTEGYRTHELICDGIFMGVPQTRRRVVLIGWRTDREPDFLFETAPESVLYDVIADIPEETPNHRPLNLPKGSNIEKIARRIRPGQKLSNVRAGQRSVHSWEIPEVFGSTSNSERKVLEALMRLRRRLRVRDYGDADPVACSAISSHLQIPASMILRRLEGKGYVRRVGRRYDLTNTFNGKYRRLRWDKPSPTVDTRFGDPRLFLHPDENRGFTVREAARIQGFEDTFIFEGPKSVQHRHVGNAVPPPIARRLAAYIQQAILE